MSLWPCANIMDCNPGIPKGLGSIPDSVKTNSRPSIFSESVNHCQRWWWRVFAGQITGNSIAPPAELTCIVNNRFAPMDLEASGTQFLCGHLEVKTAILCLPKNTFCIIYSLGLFDALMPVKGVQTTLDSVIR